MNWPLGKVYGAAVLLRLIGATLRMEVHGMERVRKIKNEGDSVVYAFFHGCLFPLLCFHRHQDVYILTSLSRDGDFASRLFRILGYRVVRGSSSRGGIRALLEMTRALSMGFDGGIAVDGPRGPKFEVKPGILLLAKKTGFPIVPIGVGFSNAQCFQKSWDEFRLPYPFSKIVLYYGEPFYVKGDLHGQEKDLERRLSDVMSRAKERAGGG